MKNTPLHLLLGILLLTLNVSAQEFEIRESNSKHISLHFSLNEFSIDTLQINGEVMHTLSSKGIIPPNDYGMPSLLTFSRFIAIPQGAKAVVKVNSKAGETIKGINIVPSEGVQCENDAPLPFFKDPKVYATDALYPASEVATADPLNLRGVDVLHIGICPVQFNPVRKEIVVHRDIDIEIEYVGGNGHFGDDRLRSPYWDPILQNNILNYNDLKPIDYGKRMQEWTKNRLTGCEYVILVPNNNAFRAAAQQLADYRNRQGIYTRVYSMDDTGATTPGMLRQWFRTAYNSWDIPPAAVCLLAEQGDNIELCIPSYRTTHPKDGFCVSDNPYADVNDDNLPDICFSRLVAQDEAEASVLVSKQMEYEYTNPNMDYNSYTHPVTASGWHTSRWFQITIETIGGFLRQHGKLPTRINNIYDGEVIDEWSSASNTSSVTNYFGPAGLGYIPASPNQLGGWDTGTKDHVIQAINAGAYLVQHRDHGWTQKWYQPEIYVTDFTGINNPGKMPFLISVNCKTGQFDASGNCFTEALLRMTRDGQNAGIVGAISPSAQSYSFGNDVYLWGVWDLFDPTFLPDYGPDADHVAEWIPSFANVSGKYFLEQQVFPNTTAEMLTTTYNIYHTHADAFLKVFTDVPQNISVSHDATIASFTPFHITASAGTQIAITCNRNRQVHILALVEATGEEQEILINEQVLPAEGMHLTITGLNFLRYEENLMMQPITFPCVTVANYNLHDGSLFHLAQDLTMDITLMNYGPQTSGSGTATLYTDSEYIHLVNATTEFSSIEPDGSLQLNDAFSFQIADNTPDGTSIPLGVRTEHDGNTFNYSFSIDVKSPDIVGVVTHVTDYEGNHNGYLDPGEFARLTFQITNQGHYDAEQITLELQAEDYLRVTDPYATIEHLGVGETVNIDFDVYVEWLAGETQFVQLALHALTEGLETISYNECSIGFVLEDFENGISLLIWQNDAEHPWVITNTEYYSGNASARSGRDLTDNDISTLSLTYTSNTNSDISFYCMVSSETNYDWLKFYIDGEEMDKWSGAMYWNAQSYPVRPGTHTYTWSYEKDYSVSSGNDCAWIDYIVLPAMLDGVGEQAERAMSVHPNPATDMIHISLDDAEGISVSVYDQQGKLVISAQNSTDISFKGLRPGLYHVKVVKDGNCWSSSIVKM